MTIFGGRAFRTSADGRCYNLAGIFETPQKVGNMSRLIALFACALAALLFASCASPASKLIGKWNMDMGLGYIEFQRGGRYTWYMAGVTEKGTWRVEKKELRMTLDSMAFDESVSAKMPSSPGEPSFNEMLKGMPKVEVICNYTLKGKVLTVQLSNMKDMSFTFHKQ